MCDNKLIYFLEVFFTKQILNTYYIYLYKESILYGPLNDGSWIIQVKCNMQCILNYIAVSIKVNDII